MLDTHGAGWPSAIEMIAEMAIGVKWFTKTNKSVYEEKVYQSGCFLGTFGTFLGQTCKVAILKG